MSIVQALMEEPASSHHFCQRTVGEDSLLLPGNLDEPTYARPIGSALGVDPLVGWSGGWGRKPPGYPIMPRCYC